MIPSLQRLYSLPNVLLVGRHTFEFPGEKVMSGWAVVYVALKIACHMGFRTVILVGVDHDSTWQHFSHLYPAGTPTDEGRLLRQREHFQIARLVYDSLGKRIVNLSPPSRLDSIFERSSVAEWA